MTNAINMLPCPMCGCSSINVKNEQPTDNSGGYFIECPDCGISTSLRYACGDDPIPLLAEQWNRRATAQCLHQIAEPQADALRLADDCEESATHWVHEIDTRAKAAKMLRAQHARIAELESQLEAIGAGGVEPLRKPAAAPQAVQAAVPLFWVRLLRDGLYEGPVHNNSVGGKMLRDEKPGEWHPLYLHAAPAHPAEGVPATIRMLDDRAAFEASVQKEHYWEGIRENLFDRLPSGKYAVVGIERHWQTWMAALAGTQPAAPQAVAAEPPAAACSVP